LLKWLQNSSAQEVRITAKFALQCKLRGVPGVWHLSRFLKAELSQNLANFPRYMG